MEDDAAFRVGPFVIRGGSADGSVGSAQSIQEAGPTQQRCTDTSTAAQNGLINLQRRFLHCTHGIALQHDRPRTFAQRLTTFLG